MNLKQYGKGLFSVSLTLFKILTIGKSLWLYLLVNIDRMNRNHSYNYLKFTQRLKEHSVKKGARHIQLGRFLRLLFIKLWNKNTKRKYLASKSDQTEVSISTIFYPLYPLFIILVFVTWFKRLMLKEIRMKIISKEEQNLI